GEDRFNIVIPSISILAEPPVAVVDANAEKKGTSEVAKAYLEYLYTPEAQEIIAKNFYRPIDSAVQEKYAAAFPQLRLVTVDDAFGGWQSAQKRFFGDGGVFDAIYAGGRRERAMDVALCRELQIPAKAASRSRRRPRSSIAGFGLTMGFTLGWLSPIVLLPLSALFLRSAVMGVAEFIAVGFS